MRHWLKSNVGNSIFQKALFGVIMIAIALAFSLAIVQEQSSFNEPNDIRKQFPLGSVGLSVLFSVCYTRQSAREPEGGNPSPLLVGLPALAL